ncbi:hypothetical protein B9Z19DRAFT_1137287 [Tuber borchii]|uniref:Uncharacterized protein n=1 Tax=Tuber borchii TaxID=42251 RepID=A0A2T6ZAM7_TUBBO|nr:hypothetical protein B9Z19DRAFT_1137287 [Tuber borchii]
MLVVALGVGWAAVDPDVKRLEPYFQLSKPEGATASNWIFLHYPFEFISSHWNVFWAGLALYLIFWGTRPLNSSPPTTQNVTRDIETSFKPLKKLIPFDDRQASMSATATAAGVNSKHFPSEGPDSMSGFQDWGLDSPTGQITYAIRLMKGTEREAEFDDFRDPIIIRNGLDRMHRLLFSNGLKTLLVDDFDGEEVVGNRFVSSIGIVVLPLIAHIRAGCLGLVVCLGGVFLVSHNRQNNLAGDRDTLRTNMALAAHSETLRKTMSARLLKVKRKDRTTKPEG